MATACAGLIIRTGQATPEHLLTLANSARMHGGTLIIRGGLPPQLAQNIANAGKNHVIFDIS